MESFPDQCGPLRVLVLAGGPSAEREISLKSGRAVAEALTERNHAVTLFDPQQETLAGLDASQFDVAFVALHGRYGEDGRVQTQLQRLALPYTGSSPAASASAFSKAAAKQKFLDYRVPTPPAFTFREGESIEDCVLVAKLLGFPVVVKPDRQGSSLGISFANTSMELAIAIENALAFDTQGLIETAIIGEEWTVPLLDDQVLPPIRIGTAQQFFDYDAKYLREDTAYEFPDDVPQQLLSRIQSTAQRAVRALGVSSLSRVDLRIDANGQPWVLEVNTVPGLTDHSLAPKSAARLGMTLGQLCETVCRKAIATDRKNRISRQDQQPPQGTPEIRRAS